MTSIRSPLPGRVSALSISSPVLRKRIIAKTIVAPPSTIRSNPAILPTSCPPTDGIRAASDLLANSKNRSNFSTKNPKAIIAIDVRTHARNVRSVAAWSVYRFIIVANLLAAERHYIGRSRPQCQILCRFLGRRDKDAIHTLGQPASEKRQG